MSLFYHLKLLYLSKNFHFKIIKFVKKSNNFHRLTNVKEKKLYCKLNT